MGTMAEQMAEVFNQDDDDRDEGTTETAALELQKKKLLWEINFREESGDTRDCSGDAVQ